MADIKANELEEKASNAVNGDKVIVIDSEDNSKVKLLDITKFKGESGEDGQDGTAGNDGQDGLSSYELWLADGNTGNIQVFLEFLSGEDGEDGENGSDGVDGASAYQSWLNLGNTGTEADFMIAVMGTDGEDGEDGLSPVPRGIWSDLNVYEKLAIVSYAGGGYISRTHQNQGDINDPIYWLQISEKGEDAEGGDMFNANNLSGLTDFDVARTNMSVYSKVESDAKFALISHNHDLDYSPINHNHSGVYEPVFTKLTAFNKNFGTGAGDVAEGNHTHASIYFTQTEISNLIATAKQEAKTETKNEILDGAGASYDTLFEIQAELQSNDTDIATILSNQSNKMDKVPSETGRFGRFLANGNLEATDISISDVTGLQSSLDGLLPTTKALLNTQITDNDVAFINGGNNFVGNQSIDGEVVINRAGGTPILRLRDNGTEKFAVYSLGTSNNVNIRATQGDGSLYFKTGTAQSTRLTIASDGEVGIGTIDPTAKLEVAGIVKVSGTSGVGFMVDYSGGYTSDKGFLTIRQSGLSRWILGTTGAESTGELGSDLILGRYNDAGTYVGKSMIFSRATGNIGIGVTSPTEALHVNGTIRATTVRVGSGTGNTRMSLNQFGEGTNTDRFYIALFDNSGNWLSNPITIDNFADGIGTRRINLGYPLRLSSTVTPTSSSGLPSGTVWSDGGTLKIA